MQSPFDLFAFLLLISAGLAYLNYRFIKLPLTVGLLLGAFVGSLLLIGLDQMIPGLGLKAAIRSVIVGVNFPDTLLKGFLAFLLFAGALQVNSADLLGRKWTILALAVVGTVLSTLLNAAALFGVSTLLHLGVPIVLVPGVRRPDLAHRSDFRARRAKAGRHIQPAASDGGRREPVQ